LALINKLSEGQEKAKGRTPMAGRVKEVLALKQRSEAQMCKT
jgi:hypothetical protein